MMRALWTAASGMKAQQVSLDTISNNLANINTTGYKRETVEFQSLLYQTIQQETTDTNGKTKPISAQVGLGVKVTAISSRFSQGTLAQSDGAFDFGIQGQGFFRIQMPDGTTGYTRNGHFLTAVNSAGTSTLTTSDGYPVLDSNGKEITIPSTIDTANLSFDKYGNISYKGTDKKVYSLGVQIGLAQFANPGGLTKLGDSYYAESGASGTPKIEGKDTSLTVSLIKNGYLEASGVEAADEMVDMIVTQRAYEMNSKAITASDEMLQQANNLRN